MLFVAYVFTSTPFLLPVIIFVFTFVCFRPLYIAFK